MSTTTSMRGQPAAMNRLARFGVVLALFLASLVLTGARPAAALAQPLSGIAATPDRGGYWLVARDGGVFGFGNAGFYGSAAGVATSPVIGIAPTPSGLGYWLVASDGGVFAYGDAIFRGSMAGQPLAAPIVGIAATTDGGGYWLAGADGGVFAFGNAVFRGSMAGQPLNGPVVGISASPTGAGYWLVASDGGIFAFGVPHHGSMGGQPLNKPMVGMAPTANGGGYWLVASDGGIFAFNAGFYGSTGSITLAQPVVGIAPGPGDAGYWLDAADGGVFAFGSAPFRGSMVPNEPPAGNGSPSETTLRNAIATEARRHVGYSPASENRSKFTENGQPAYPPRPWCADFISYVWQKAGVTDWHWKSAVQEVLDQSVALGRFKGATAMPAVGDVAIWKKPGGTPSHVSIVIAIDSAGRIRTIGGNEGHDQVVETTTFQYPQNLHRASDGTNHFRGYAMPVSSGARAAASSSQALPVPDDDSGFMPDVTVSDVTVTEGGTASFTVTLNVGVSYQTSVSYTTIDGTATSAAGVDYSARSGTLVFTPGQVSKTVTVPTTNDLLPETTESFTLALTTVDGVTIYDGIGTGTILDNDGLARVA